MLIDDLETLEQLGKVVVRLTSNPALRDDLMQEALIHLWQTQEQNPGQTKNWYLQNCRFHLLHYLASGRSVDSPKRRASQVLPSDRDDNAEDCLDRLEAADCVLEDVSARDILNSLAKVLSARDMRILLWLTEGAGTREIARKLGISHPMVVKIRRRIAALARKLSIGPPRNPKDHAGTELFESDSVNASKQGASS
jgi:RNA polymerase sigma factor (sigma-70 family)